jgi:hypothetical protein
MNGVPVATNHTLAGLSRLAEQMGEPPGVAGQSH